MGSGKRLQLVSLDVSDGLKRCLTIKLSLKRDKEFIKDIILNISSTG